MRGIYTGTGRISSYRSVFSGTKRFYWNDEGKLSSARADGTASFEYDANGMRTLKEGTFDHEYYYEGTRLVMETVDGVKLIYLYDESGNVEAIRYNGASYYLIRNILGDVVQLRNAQNELIANYSYNAYGLPLSITNASGAEITNEAHIALINPIRYRGYYYDNETGLYYLESRYYDPELCRFISADALLITSPIGMNLYAYCGNDPVNFVDPHGYLCLGNNPDCYCTDENCTGSCPGCNNFPYPHMLPFEEDEEDPSDPIDISTPGFTLPGVPVGGGGGGGYSGTSSPSGSTSTAVVPYYPPNDGFQGEVKKVTLVPGTELQRTGKASSPFVAPYNTPTERLSLPYYQIGQPTIKLEVKAPIEALSGVAAPWFGQIGGGTQYKLYMNLDFYLQNGQIIKVGK